MSDCLLCPNPLQQHERQCCVACVAHVRAELEDIGITYALLPAELEHHADEHIPGGDALVMLAPGSTGWAAVEALLHAPGEWTGERWDITAGQAAFAHYADENATDPPAVLFDLSRWQDDWADIRGETTGPARLIDVVTWLMRRLDWAAAHHPAFDEFAHDVHLMTVRLQIATATADWPLLGARCQYDDTLLVREYRDPKPCSHGPRPDYERRSCLHPDGTSRPEPANLARTRWFDRLAIWETTHKRCDQGGLAPLWRCSRCRRRYTNDEYRLALRKQAGTSVGWMPLHLAADFAGVGEKDLRNWIDRGQVGALCNLRWHDDKAVRSGPLMVFWADVLVRIAARKAA